MQFRLVPGLDEFPALRTLYHAEIRQQRQRAGCPLGCAEADLVRKYSGLVEKAKAAQRKKLGVRTRYPGID